MTTHSAHRRLSLLTGVLATTIAAATLSGPASAGSANAPTQSKPEEPARAYRNAVLNRDFPDPDVIKLPNGTYLAYSTNSERRGRFIHIQVAKSKNLVDWKYLGDALPKLPTWGDDAVVSWAPQVVRQRHRYVMFYSTVPDRLQNDFGLCIAAATSKRPAGPFKATKKPVYCGPTLSDIDAYVLKDKKADAWRMYWGSGGDIVTTRLAPSLTKLANPGAEPKLLLRGWSAKVKRPFEHGIEGPFVMARHGWYYLFYSGNRCCEYPPHYATMVARSRHAAGPYRRLATKRPGLSSVILHGNERWAGPGHNSVIRDDAGKDWIVFHAIDHKNPYIPSGDGVRRAMLISPLNYRNGWPVIRTQSPAVGWNPAPVDR